MKTLEFPFDEETYAAHGYPTPPASYLTQFDAVSSSLTSTEQSKVIEDHILEMTDETLNFTSFEGTPSTHVTMAGILNPQMYLK